MVCKRRERERASVLHFASPFSTLPTLTRLFTLLSQGAGDDDDDDDDDFRRDLLGNLGVIRDETEELKNLLRATRHDAGAFKGDAIAHRYRSLSDIEEEIEALETQGRDLEEMVNSIDRRSAPARDATAEPDEGPRAIRGGRGDDDEDYDEDYDDDDDDDDEDYEDDEDDEEEEPRGSRDAEVPKPGEQPGEPARRNGTWSCLSFV